MTKINLTTVGSGYLSQSSINDNFTTIKNEFQNKVLYRDNPSGEPNSMQSNLDMNGYYVLNAGNASLVDADNIVYTPSGTGAEARTVGDKLNDIVSVKDFGAVGDGVTDDTAAIQAALNTAQNVFVPPGVYAVTAALTLTANGQTLYGAGETSEIRQSTASANVVAAVSRSDVLVEKLRLRASGANGSYTTAGGVLFNGCTRAVARDVIVENHRGAGVCLYNTNDSEVSGCTFLNSPVQNLDGNTITLADIGVVYSSSRNYVHGNRCTSGNATGVQIQSVADGDACDDNRVIGNHIENCKAYGIIAYRNSDTPTQSVARAVIANNTIKNITGTIENEVVSNYSFGAGIYLQGAEDSVVNGNALIATHSGAVTFAETLAPGAIGATNIQRYTINGNTIEDAGMFGVHIGDPNTFGISVGHGVISNNKITNATRAGINVANCGRINISGNSVDTTGNSAIRINNTVTQKPSISVTGNTIKNVTGTSAIECNYVVGLQVSGNLIDTASTHGISAANCAEVNICGNTVIDHASRGITILSTCTRVSVTANTINGTGSSSEGIRFDVAGFESGNVIRGCTSDYAGTVGLWRTLTDNSATPSVEDGSFFLCGNSSATTITNFANGQDGQCISVVFTNGNTTLDFTSSNLKGNSGVDRIMATADAIEAVYRAAAFAWYVTVIDV